MKKLEDFVSKKTEIKHINGGLQLAFVGDCMTIIAKSGQLPDEVKEDCDDC